MAKGSGSAGRKSGSTDRNARLVTTLGVVRPGSRIRVSIGNVSTGGKVTGINESKKTVIFKNSAGNKITAGISDIKDLIP